MKESQAALDSGKIETAVSLLETASKANPSDAAPWLKQAQVYFDADNYPAAIQASDEAMKRDPLNKDAKAIAVVASLRVAIRALSDMNQDSLLRGSSRSEAERLARALRETLAQDQLVPISDPKQSAGKRAPARRPAASAPAKTGSSETPASAPVTAAPAAAAPAKSSGSSSGNPFGALR
ncbi:tetratricopeptide repeat protein [Uliginosibacterium paludis]|uniref:Tetratricopeptide repeat protein n=1 Tax=Uliginosibacterium paludis TaxID=1615952 RepID=A0ABV2CPW1_9RHOO